MLKQHSNKYICEITKDGHVVIDVAHPMRERYRERETQRVSRERGRWKTAECIHAVIKEPIYMRRHVNLEREKKLTVHSPLLKGLWSP